VHNGPAAITGWTVTWAFAGGQTVAQAWNGVSSQTGANVTVRNAAWNGALAPSASTTFGFTGTRTGPHVAPTVSCARA
jgi:cellulase/cellobiase CelA1